MVVQDDEVTNVAELVVHLAIKFRPSRLLDAAVGKHLHQPDDATLNEVNAGRLERFEESSRQAQAYTVSIPVFFPLARAKAEHPGFCEDFTFKIVEQGDPGVIVTQELTAIDQPVTDPGL